MRWGLLLFTLTGLCWTGSARASEAPVSPESRPAPSATAPIPWRQNLFSIPFKISPGADEANQPVEVQLFVSDDHGANWRLESRVKPEQGSFTFQAPRDGEFWFAIRTVDKQNRVRPEGNPTPELRVVVDTQAPQLELQAFRADSGEVVARWRIIDPNVDPASLKIDYRADVQQPWRAVAVDRGKIDPASGGGQITFFPPERGPSLVVRATANDRAGNPAVAQVAVEANPRSVAERPANVTNLSSNPAAERNPKTFPTGMSTQRDPWLSSGAGRGDGTGWPPEQATTLPVGRDPLKRGNPPLPSMSRNYPDEYTSGRANQGASIQNLNNTSPSLGAANDRLASNDLPGHSVKTMSLSRGNGNENTGAEYLPRGEEPRRVNSTTFEMEYDVDSVGPSGIARVEMFCTRDGGRSWSSCGVDPDNRSPMKVTVDGEGVYGFRLVIQSGIGLGGRPPQSGDQPEVWVDVDLTPPAARLISAELGAGTRAGELVINWEASDSRLAVRPVALSFSSTPGGPWTTIAAGLDNTGSYGWRLDSRVPERVYLRLEVRDEAGNVAVVESAEAVALDQVRPQGRIRSVRPVSDGSSRQSRLSQLWR